MPSAHGASFETYMWLLTKAKRLSPTKLIGLEVLNFYALLLTSHDSNHEAKGKKEWIIFNHVCKNKSWIKAYSLTYMGLIIFKLNAWIGQTTISNNILYNVQLELKGSLNSLYYCGEAQKLGPKPLLAFCPWAISI